MGNYPYASNWMAKDWISDSGHIWILLEQIRNRELKEYEG
jgi:hypothetical protein